MLQYKHAALLAATQLPRPQWRAPSNAAHGTAASVSRSWLAGPTRGADERQRPECLRQSSELASGGSCDQLETDFQGLPAAAIRAGISEGLYYDWRYHSRVHYIQAGSEGPAVLLIHGFGVGGWQFKVGAGG